ncbi:MAG: glycosyltransferase family 2 protein [Verrucomicrobia bacterium]|nr:glycosyltransferase family 2 protein [Verrucomicrobiota bacterium]
MSDAPEFATGPGSETSRRPDYSIVVPFYNESANAAALLAEINEVMAQISPSYEVVMVNDGSSDATVEILSAVAAAHPQCRLLNLSPNRGQASALYHGLKAATAPLIITMDGDGQNCPADIPALLDKLRDADMVVGIRMNRQDTWLRRQISRLANAVRSRILGDGVSDSGCALKVFRREVVNAFVPIRTLYSFMPALAVAAGFRVKQAPVTHRARGGGKSSYGLMVFLWRPLLDLLGVWWFCRRRFPENTSESRANGSPQRGS